jgi:ATP-binding cassette subfamily B protein
MDSFLAQPVGFFTARRSGELVSTLLNDVEAVDSILSQRILALASSSATLVGMLVVMFVLNWELSLLTLLVVPFVLLPARFAARTYYRTRLQVQEQLAELTVYAQEVLGISGIMLVKAFGRTGIERARFRQVSGELRHREIRAALAARWFIVVQSVWQTVAPMSILLVGGLLIIHGESGLGTVLAFSTVIVSQFSSDVQAIIGIGLSVAGSLGPWERIFAVLDVEPELVSRPGADPLPASAGEIRFDNVSFSYPGAERPALDGVSAVLAPGQVTALVGPSGAGKTTFSTLLCRFADPAAGTVSFAGVDLRDVALDSLQQAVGVVFQDAFLFHTTLRENLRYGRPDADDTTILEVARETRLDGVIAGLPEGLDTVVGERGHRLSGGEKQRVALARVLLADPRILVLDEATAHLDTASERAVQAALGRLLRGRTSLVIAHRLSTVVAADQILVLDEGRIVQRGTHDALLAEGGLYAGLYANGFSEETSAPAASGFTETTSLAPAASGSAQVP